MLIDFLKNFTGSYIQTFEDKKSGDTSLIRKFPYSDLKARWKELQSLNERGAGIFFTPNPCSGGRKMENVTSIDWIYVDMDEGTKKEMMAVIEKSPVFPDIITESKRSYHLYWKCHFENKEQFEEIVQGLIQFYDGDKAISSINEVLRFPNFYHAKDPKNRFLIKIVYLKVKGTTPATLKMDYPYTPPMETFQKKHKLEGNQLQVIKDIPIKEVLDKLDVTVGRGKFIMEGGKETSASVNVKENYVQRFSGKPGGGSTIDVAMHYGNKKTVGEAIKWLADEFGIKLDYSQIKNDSKKPKKSEKDLEKIAEKIHQSQDESVFDNFMKPVAENNRTWGVKVLDQRFRKPRAEEYIFLLGKPGAGKTAFCLHMAIKNAQNGVKTVYVSLEMSRTGLIERYIETAAGITEEQREGGRESFTEEQIEMIEECRTEIEQSTLRIIDDSVFEDSADIDILLKLMEKYDMAFIDNFGFLGGEEEAKDQRMISRKVVKWFQETKKTVVMLHHFAKGQTGKVQAEGRGSEKLLDDCTRWTMVERDLSGMGEVKENDNTMFKETKFKVQKDRGRGITGNLTVLFDRGRYYKKKKEDVDLGGMGIDAGELGI